MVLVEVRILRSDDGVLEIGRDLGERNEFVALAIRGAVNPGLQTALHVHRCGGWVDPPGGDKDQRGKRPKKRKADDKPLGKGSEGTRPKRGIGVRVRYCSHVSE